jgi:hypothetical protein
MSPQPRGQVTVVTLGTFSGTLSTASASPRTMGRSVPASASASGSERRWRVSRCDLTSSLRVAGSKAQGPAMWPG